MDRGNVRYRMVDGGNDIEIDTRTELHWERQWMNEDSTGIDIGWATLRGS